MAKITNNRIGKYLSMALNILAKNGYPLAPKDEIFEQAENFKKYSTA